MGTATWVRFTPRPRGPPDWIVTPAWWTPSRDGTLSCRSLGAEPPRCHHPWWSTCGPCLKIHSLLSLNESQCNASRTLGLTIKPSDRCPAMARNSVWVSASTGTSSTSKPRKMQMSIMHGITSHRSSARSTAASNVHHIPLCFWCTFDRNAIAHPDSRWAGPMHSEPRGHERDLGTVWPFGFCVSKYVVRVWQRIALNGFVEDRFMGGHGDRTV